MQQKPFLRLLLEPLALAFGLALAARVLIQIYTIPSASMEPSLRAGDHILVTRTGVPFLGERPERGDVVVFRSPLNHVDVMVKRIAGEPGDLVNAGDGRMVVVPSGCYFVLGDNRSNSFDSRSWGPLPQELVLGRARVILWSSAQATARSSSPPAAHAATRSLGPTPSSAHSFRFFQPIR